MSVADTARLIRERNEAVKRQAALLALCEEVLEYCATADSYDSGWVVAHEIATKIRRGVDAARRQG